MHFFSMSGSVAGSITCMSVKTFTEKIQFHIERHLLQHDEALSY